MKGNDERLIDIQNLSFRYNQQKVLDDINLTVNRGAFLGLVGPNGSGKSTLLKCLLGLLKPDEGSIKLFGEDISVFNEWFKIGYVSQKANSFNSGFPATVNEVVSTGLVSKAGLFKRLSKDDKEKIISSIQAVGMEKFLNRNIGELSGGQQQRVFIARALVSEPELLILDEPTVGIDAETVQNFYNMLGKLNKDRGITLVLVTHDIGTITDKVSHVACLNQHLHFHGNTGEFSEQQDKLSQFYGHHVHVLDHDHGGCEKC
ncbi:metal ABC transporter ATP-binding protein [Bacillus suaedaesalsae]|uniref:Metal ABC transporter ATP-binding protein n=1 Tax=Bacillus suaedaesalsae TaxID=2810349 RepID=A0ABS2DLB8_9BACI|nr:metal ABC transporter ATP-binding protein [Bacillus suaedaesalsae]MBM6619282.1 metal ABC transporter ATP-binding protein [Bacillus suaedaesalsae]